MRLSRCGLVALIVVVAAGGDDPAPTEIVESSTTFKSRGLEIDLDVIAPAAEGRYPAVVILHGAGGIGAGRRSMIHEQGRRLARAGFVALVPHYFGRSKPDRKNGLKNARSFDNWTRAVRDAIGAASKRHDVDPKRIGVLGSSLGSWVALSVAARDRRVGAVVENFGGFPEWEALDPRRLPPVLILHGDADRNVPVERATELEQILQRAGVSYEIHIYPGAGHGFRGADSEDAARRTLQFFDDHLKPSPRPH